MPDFRILLLFLLFSLSASSPIASTQRFKRQNAGDRGGGDAVVFGGGAPPPRRHSEAQRAGKKVRDKDDRDGVVVIEPAGEDEKKKADASPLDYLFQFGYLPKTSSRTPFGDKKIVTEDSPVFTQAVRDFQEFAGLPSTGRLDRETTALMRSPRCGVADKRRDSPRRFRRYITHSSKWETTHLKYYIASYPSDSLMRAADVDAEIERAFRVWQDKTVLTFERTFSRSDADLALDFFRGNHGGDEPFDGRGGVLAHAFFPRWGGDVHFDAAETWVNDELRHRVRRDADPKQLLQTAVHEIGHSLGLEHSRNRDAIMAPFYHGWLEDIDLRQDDIDGIAAIYGKKKKTTVNRPHTTKRPSVVLKPSRRPRPTSRPRPTTTTTTSPAINFNPGNNKPAFKPKNDLCSKPVFDALTQTLDGGFYVFKGAQYWKLKGSSAGVEPGYPRSVSDWSGMPGKVDAAFFNPRDGFTYFFRGANVGKYLNKQIEPGYPKPIADEFPGMPAGVQNLDAALFWGYNRQAYFFKGSRYWKFNFGSRRVQAGYPKRVTENWVGVPSHLAAAVRWKNGKSYFFDKFGQYYRFNDQTFSVTDSARVAYPRRVAKWWLGCEQPRQEEVDASEESSESSAEDFFTDKDYVYEYSNDDGDREPKRRWVWSE